MLTSSGPDDAASAPLWMQVMEKIASELASADAPPGTRLESEQKLCDRFGVSRVTIRQALNELRRRGLVNSKAGLGWFAGPGEESDVLHATPGVKVSFSEMARSKGLNPDAVVLSHEVTRADYEQAAHLMIAPGSLLLSLRRLRLLNGIPVAVDENRVPYELVPNSESVDFSHESLFAEMRRFGTYPDHCDYEVEATAANEDDAQLLGTVVGFPLLVTREVLYDKAHRPIAVGSIRYRGDRYRFRAVLAV